MTRYFFDLRDGERLVPDQDGLEFDDIDAVKSQAVKTLAEVVKDALPDGTHRQIAILVREGADAPLLTAEISFSLRAESESFSARCGVLELRPG